MAECEYEEIIITPPEWPEDECIVPEGTLEISENGEGIDVREYEFVDVNVSCGGSVLVVDTPDEHGGTIREITATDAVYLAPGSATPDDTEQTITPSQGYDGFNEFTVAPIPPEYIIPTGTKQITENGDGIDVSAFASVDVNVPTGASNIVFGTFTTNSTAGVQTISIPYTGNGYPMMAQIFATGGINATNQQAWHDSVVSRQIGAWSFTKRIMSPAPTYDDATEKNLGSSTWTFKNSSSDPSVFGAQGNASAQIYRSSGAASGGASCCRFTDDTTLSIYVDGTGDVYGFPNSVEFTYMIVYSE